MFIIRAAKYDNVVQIREASTLKHSAENNCHQAHEGGGCRRESKRHNCVFKKSERRAERSFLSVVRMHLDLIVSHCQVERRDKTGTRESVKYSWRRVCVSCTSL